MQDHDTPPPSGRRKSTPTSQTCEQCGKQFTPKGSTTGFFCSRDCYWAWRRKTGLLGFSRLEGSTFVDGRTRLRHPATDRQRLLFQNPERVSDNDPGDDLLWAERGRYWQAPADAASVQKEILPLDERKPLVLTGHGVRLRVDHNTLLVCHGFTHYPQEQREQRFFPGDLRLPSRIILISTDGSISLDVARWLSEQRVPLVILDYRGEVVSVLGVETTACDLRLRRAQIEAGSNGAGLRLACRLIEQKLGASLATLADLRESTERASAQEVVASGLRQMRQDPPPTAEELRLLEARSAVAYFGAWHSIPLLWKRTGKCPIPSDWKQIGRRNDLLRHRNRHAQHPVNAMLNYGYAVLESQVRMAIAGLGLDPTIGFLHANQPGRDALVYDLMEPFRPQVDQQVLEFVRSTVLSPRDFLIDSRGVCRLHPELARVVVNHTSLDELPGRLSTVVGILRNYI